MQYLVATTYCFEKNEGVSNFIILSFAFEFITKWQILWGPLSDCLIFEDLCKSSKLTSPLVDSHIVNQGHDRPYVNLSDRGWCQRRRHGSMRLGARDPQHMQGTHIDER